MTLVYIEKNIWLKNSDYIRILVILIRILVDLIENSDSLSLSLIHFSINPTRHFFNIVCLHSYFKFHHDGLALFEAVKASIFQLF